MRVSRKTVRFAETSGQGKPPVAAAGAELILDKRCALNQILLMIFSVVITEAEEGGYMAFNPETGTTTQSETFDEARPYRTYASSWRRRSHGNQNHLNTAIPKKIEGLLNVQGIVPQHP